MSDSGYDGLNSVQINAMPSMTLPTTASSTSSAQYLNIPTGYNGTAQYYMISASSGSSKNFQVSNSQVRLQNKTALTDTGLTLTVSKTGTYNVYWSAFRTNTSSGYTWGDSVIYWEFQLWIRKYKLVEQLQPSKQADQRQFNERSSATHLWENTKRKQLLCVLQ